VQLKQDFFIFPAIDLPHHCLCLSDPLRQYAGKPVDNDQWSERLSILLRKWRRCCLNPVDQFTKSRLDGTKTDTDLAGEFFQVLRSQISWVLLPPHFHGELVINLSLINRRRYEIVKRGQPHRAGSVQEGEVFPVGIGIADQEVEQRPVQ
jgi:hypothetical protein